VTLRSRAADAPAELEGIAPRDTSRLNLSLVHY
jgi:hypothetical protein